MAGRELGLNVFRRAGLATDFAVVGGSGITVLTPSTVNVFQARIPVQAGDLLGLRVGNPPSGGPLDFGGGASCAFTAAAGNTIREGGSSGNPGAGTVVTMASVLPTYRLNLTATIEPDADGDGFGDESQDPCPAAAGPGAACPAGAAPGGPGGDTAAPADTHGDTRPPTVTTSGRRTSGEPCDAARGCA